MMQVSLKNMEKRKTSKIMLIMFLEEWRFTRVDKLDFNDSLVVASDLRR